jgi:hypothetical protein
MRGNFNALSQTVRKNALRKTLSSKKKGFAACRRNYHVSANRKSHLTNATPPRCQEPVRREILAVQ